MPPKKKKTKNDVGLLINTHASNEDCLEVFFGELERYKAKGLFKNIYILSNREPRDTHGATFIEYKESDTFVTQMRCGLEGVKEETILYCNEDYVLNGKVNKKNFEEYVVTLNADDWISYIRFVYTDLLKTEEFIPHLGLRLVPYFSPHCFSQVATLWKKSALLDIHNVDVPFSIGEKGMVHGHFEEYGNKLVFDKKIMGAVQHTEGAKKIGIYHYESKVFPHIATAVVKGKWNVGEYPELVGLLGNYGIDENIRGTC